MAGKGYTNLSKTLLLLGATSCFSGFCAYALQSMASSKVSSCSYLDPISIDLVAFVVGLFFVIEGLYDIIKHKESMTKNQFPRCVRVSFGVCIITIHIMQVIHK